MTTNKRPKFSYEPITITEIQEKRSFGLLRFVGYALLAFSVINYLAILIPPQLTNPSWEFQTIGTMVDNVWSILLGFTFIFLFNHNSIVEGKEIVTLKFFSWLALTIGIIFLLMLPLGINNTLTLYRNINNQFTNQQAQQQEQIEQITERLQQVTSSQQLLRIAANLNIAIEPNSNQAPDELKKQMSEAIATAGQNVLNNADRAKEQQTANLIKTSVRFNLGALISGVCFIVIWRLTLWTRNAKKNVS
jgi:preprotein translocase subunit SecF